MAAPDTPSAELRRDLDHDVDDDSRFRFLDWRASKHRCQLVMVNLPRLLSIHFALQAKSFIIYRFYICNLLPDLDHQDRHPSKHEALVQADEGL